MAFEPRVRRPTHDDDDGRFDGSVEATDRPTDRSINQSFQSIVSMFGTPTGPTGPTPSVGVFGTPGGTTSAPNGGGSSLFGGAATATPGGFGTPGGGGGAALRGAAFGGDPGTGVYGQPMPYGGGGQQQMQQQQQQQQNRRAGAASGNATPGAVKGAPRFSSLLFASPTNVGDSPGGGAGGLYRTESSMGGASTPRTSSGQNRYFGGGGATTANRGKLEERPTPAPAAVIGGVSSRGTPLFTRTETGGGGGGDDHTPGFLRRAIEKTHAENMAASAPGDEALNAWLRSGENAKKKIESSTGKAFTVSEVLSDSEAEHWVTVYGFSKDEKALVLREFQRDGDIVNFGDFNENGESTNWLHVRFATKESARRALRRNGQNMNGIMVGVKELDAKSKAEIGSGKGGEGRLSRNAAVRRVAPMRDGISLQPRQRTTWDKVVEFVFGA